MGLLKRFLKGSARRFSILTDEQTEALITSVCVILIADDVLTTQELEAAKGQLEFISMELENAPFAWRKSHPERREYYRWALGEALALKERDDVLACAMRLSRLFGPMEHKEFVFQALVCVAYGDRKLVEAETRALGTFRLAFEISPERSASLLEEARLQFG